MTDLQKRFCEEYVIDNHISKAALRAGYQGDGARMSAWQAMQQLDVQEYIEQLQNEAALRCQVSKDDLLREFKKIGFSNIRNYLHNDLDVKYLSEVETPEAIKSVKKTVKTFGEDGREETTEITLHDKLSALIQIGRHIGFFSEDNAQKNTVFQIMNVDPLDANTTTNDSTTEDSIAS